MHILDSQDRIIRKVFPTYDRAKSSVVFELGASYHDYDGIVEKSNCGIIGDKYKVTESCFRTRVYYILNGRLV